jgi:ABC-type nitrate/sulfonate/bicarbonate transport system substrate-binding protein
VSVVEEWLPDAFDDTLFDNLEPSLRPELVQALRARKDFLLEHGFIRQDFAIDDWIAPGPLAAAQQRVQDEAVQARAA